MWDGEHTGMRGVKPCSVTKEARDLCPDDFHVDDGQYIVRVIHHDNHRDGVSFQFEDGSWWRCRRDALVDVLVY